MNEQAQLKTVHVPPTITVGDFASAADLAVTKVIAELMKNGVMATINEQIDFETAVIVGTDLGLDVQAELRTDGESLQSEEKPELDSTKLKRRPPVVTVMGHVDHGKTSLLDVIRASDVAAKESGGITQHIGAYQVKNKSVNKELDGRLITFLDTPGHEAFSAMRSHGANLTDVAVIVVAADDGVKPQTVESIKQAKAAEVPMLVAINKIDKPEANIVKVKQELSDNGLVAEDWGGDTIMVEVSAKQKQGIDKLLEMILLVADVKDTTAVYDCPAFGAVIESHMDSGKGPIATVLIQNGTLKTGQYFVVGDTYGKVRTMEDYRGQKMATAEPSTPVLISGLKEVPSAGDHFRVVASEKEAKSITDSKKKNHKIGKATDVKKIGVSEINQQVIDSQIKEYNVVIKADVQGSLEALTQNLEALGNGEVAVRIISSGIGDINESDIKMASASSAIICGFHVKVPSLIGQLALRDHVTIKNYKVIYELIEDAKKKLSSMLAPEVITTEVGKLKVLQIFKDGKQDMIVGGEVTTGKMVKGAKFRIMRGEEQAGEGEVVSVHQGPTEVDEIEASNQCGLKVSVAAKIAVDDKLEAYTVESKARSL